MVQLANMQNELRKYRGFLSDTHLVVSTALSFMILVASFAINYEAAVFAFNSISNPVTDLILDHVEIRDVMWLFTDGTVIFWGFCAILLALNPRKIAFTVKSIALFIIIRSLFIILTHIAPFPTHPVLEVDSVLNYVTLGGDLFFSGHTGLPFLMALLFWEERTLRYFFLASSILFGWVVLVGHFHYSIDVFAAFFITYTIADIARFLFRHDYQAFLNHPAVEN